MGRPRQFTNEEWKIRRQEHHRKQRVRIRAGIPARTPFTVEERKFRRRERQKVAYAKRVGRPVRVSVSLTNFTAEERKLRTKKQNKNATLKHYYGLSLAEYEAMIEQQNGRCAICNTDTPGGFGCWEVDHCHDTNVVRHLLCHRCNMGLGYFKHDVRLFQAAIDYLTKFCRT